MGRRGPKPTPKAILGMRGSWRADQRPAEPQPTATAPTCPDWLPAEAKRKWRELVPELSRLGLLTVVDGGALAAYCSAWSELRQATERLQKEGRYLKTATGYTYSHPAVAQQRSAWAAVRAFAALFGLDPADRSRVSVHLEPSDKDPLEQELCKREQRA